MIKIRKMTKIYIHIWIRRDTKMDTNYYDQTRQQLYGCCWIAERGSTAGPRVR